MEKIKEILIDENKQYIGFVGSVLVGKHEIFINTKTKEGYGEVVDKLKNTITFLAKKYRVKGEDFEDTKQNIILEILEGISKYDPRENQKLSSFLQMRLSRRLINSIRNSNRMRKDANILNEVSFRFKCGCGHIFIKSTQTQNNNIQCPSCNANIKTKNSISQAELSLDDFLSSHNLTQNDITGNIFEVYDEYTKFYMRLDLENILSKEDKTNIDIINLIYGKQLSVSEASKTLNISSAKIYSRLKDIKANKKLLEILVK